MWFKFNLNNLIFDRIVDDFGYQNDHEIGKFSQVKLGLECPL